MPDQDSRAIGTIGTVSRVGLGLLFLSPVFFGGFRLWELIVGAVVVPLAILVIQRVRLILTTEPIRATGLLGFVINFAVFLALYLTPLYAPRIAFTSNLVLIFYGVSMLLAAARGYAGCEVTAISNWLLGRDDQVGCVVFTPVDVIEARIFPPSSHDQDGSA